MKQFRTHRKVVGVFMMALAGWAQVSQPLRAATVYWDTNGSTAGSSGGTTASGTWDAAGAFWNNAPGTGTAAAWTSGDIAVFSAGTNATGASAITVSGTQGIGGLVFEEGNVTLSGGTLQLTQNAIVSVAAGLAATLSSDLTGAFSLTKTGAGILDYQGNGTGLTGAVQVAGGTLKLSGSGVLTGASSITLSNRGTLTLDNAATNLGDRVSAAITSNGGTLNFTHPGAAGTTYAELLSTLVVNPGTLAINTSQAASGQTSTLVISSFVRSPGGIVSFSGTGLGTDTRNSVVFSTAPSLTNSIVPWMVVSNGTLTSFATFATSGGSNQTLVPLALASHLQGNMSTWTATGNARPSASRGDNTARSIYSLTLDNGVNIAGTTATGATTALSADRIITITGPVLQTGGTSSITANGNSEWILAFGTNEAIFHTIGDLTIQRGNTNNITGSGGLTKSGIGRLTVSANAVTGVVRLNEGTYRAVTNTNALGAGTVEFNGGNAELAADASVNFGRATTVNADATITIDRVTAAATAVTHTLGALSMGSSTLNIAAGPNITSGTAYGMTFGAAAFTGNSVFNVANNGAGTGTLTLGTVTNPGFTITKQGAGDLITNAATGFGGFVEIQAGRLGWSNNTAANVVSEGGVISGAGGVVKTGASTVSLSGINTYTGATTIMAGALQAIDGIGLPTASNLVFNGGVFQSSGTFTRSLGAGAGQMQWAAGANGGFAANGGPLTVTVGGVANPLTLDLAFLPSGVGVLTFGSATADNVVTLTNNIDLNNTGAALSRTFSVTDNTGSTADKAVLSGVLSNSGAAGGLTKTGNGILELAGINTFTGQVVVTQGTLQFTSMANLGQAADISLGGGSLSYIGGSNFTFSRPVTLTAASTVDASGTGGAVLTFQSAVTGNFGFTLDGSGTGVFSSTLAQTGTTADLTKNGAGTWTLTTTNTLADDLLVNNGTLNINVAQSINDDFVVTGASTVVNINAAAAMVNGDDLYIRGALVKLGVNGAITNAVDDLNISVDSLSGGTLDIAGTTGSAPTDIFLGNTGGFTGSLIDSVGGGSVGATGTLGVRDGVISANLTGAAAMTKTTLANVTLSGANTGYTGSATLSMGTLTLDFTTNNGEKLSNTGAGALTGNGGTLVLNGNASAATTETLGGFTVNAGATHITVNNGAGQTATLNLAGITRTAVGGTVDFVMSSPSATIQSSAANAFGNVLGGYATVGGSKFATVSSGQVVGLNSTVKNSLSTWAAGDDVTDGSTGYTGSVGSLRINTLRFDAAGVASAVSVTAGNLLQVRSGGILVTSNVGAGTGSITGGRLMSGNGVDLIILQNNTAADFTIGSTIIGPGLTKSGAGTLLLSGTNYYSGQTTINEGTLRISGGSAIGDLSAVSIKNGPGALLNVNNSSETIGTLAGGGGDGGQVDIGTGTLIINETAATTYSGLITGSGLLIKNGSSTLTFNTGANSFSGALVINQGQITLGDRTDANFSSLSSLVVNNGVLLLDFTGGTEGSPNKINNTATVALVNTGAGDGLRANNDRNDASKAEAVGDLTLVAGANTITVQANATVGTTARQMTITAASLIRSNNATLLVRGNNLGDLGATVTNSGRVVITTAPSGNNFVGGAGAAGTTTQSIVPWAIGSATATNSTTHGTGSSFVTYVATTGFRPLALDTEYEQLVAGGGITAANNVRYAGSADLTLGSATARTMNALLVENTSTTAGITLAGAGASLNLASGAMLFVGTQAITLGGFSGITVGAPNEYVLHVPSTAAAGVTISSPFTTTAAVLTKSGAGTLILSATNSTYTGATVVNQGTLQINGLNNLGNSGSGGLVLNGGTLRFGAVFDPSSVPVTLGLATPVTNVTTTAGGTFDTNGFDITLAASIGNNGNGGLVKAGAGTLTLGAPATHTGLTTINAGTLLFGVANALAPTMNVALGGGTLDTAGFTTTLSSLTVAANSTLAGSAPLTFAGNTFVDGGAARTLTVSNTGLTSFTGDMFYLTSTGTTARAFTLAGTGDVTIASQIMDGPAAGSSLTVTSSGTVRLSGVNTYTGTTTMTSAAGTLVLSGINRTGGATTLTNGTLQLDNPVNGGLADGTLTLTAGTLMAVNAARSISSLTILTGGTIGGSQDLAFAGNFEASGGGSRTLTVNNTGLTSFTGSTLTLVNSGTTARTLTFAGSGNVVIASQIVNGTAAGTLNMAGTGTLTITSGSNSYTGTTTVDNGTLVMAADQTLTGALRFGSSTSVTTTGTLNLSSANATFGGLTVQNNSSTGGLITLGTGRTLTLTGNVQIGATTPLAGDASAKLTMAGGGSLVVNTAAGGSFVVGGSTSVSQNSILDLTGLSSATINVSATGTVRVNQPTGTNAAGNQSALLLPTPTLGITSSTPVTTITASNFNVGDNAGNGAAAGQVNSVVFGTGLTTLNVNTVNIGTGSRDLGQLTYAPGNGTLVLRAADGVGRAAFNVGTGTASTGVAAGAGVANRVDFTGHSVDLLISALTIGGQNRNTARTDIFSFDTGVLDATAVVVGTNNGSANSSAASTVWDSSLNLGGGTVTIGSGGLDIAHAPVAVTGTDTLNGTVTISGGAVTIDNNSAFGAAVRLSNSVLANGPAANGSLIITGGSLTVGGSIIKGATTGAGAGLLRLAGGTLEMNGQQIGSSSAPLAFLLESGTLKNLAEFNGGAALVKTTSGTLLFDGSSTYSGLTDLQEGVVIAVGGADNRLGMSGLSLGSGAVSATLQLGNAAGSSSQMVASLATSGTGTANAIFGGHSSFSTLTVDQSINTTFGGALGGAGASQNNLNLVKSGAGELVIGGPATLAGTVTIGGGKLFFDGYAGPSTTLTSLTLADGTEFSLRGSAPTASSVYNFSGTGAVVTVGGGVGATLGFALDGAYNTQLNLAAGQTLLVNGALTTAIYVHSAPNAGQQYVLINGADDGSIFASGTFNLNPVVFNGGSFTYALSKVTAGAGEKWVLTPSAQAAAGDVWWKGDLTGIGTGVWSASTTSGTGFPTNWDTTQSGGVDALVPPDSGSIVHFSANGAANFATTLGASLTIQELIFHAGGTAISIGSSGGTNILTLGNTVDASGLTLLSGAPNVALNVGIVLAQAQAWNIADSGTVLTLSAGVSGVGPLSINNNGTSSGKIILTGPSALLTYSGGTSLVAGWLTLEGGADDRLPATGALVMGDATQGAVLQLGDFTNGVSNTTIGSLSSGASTASSIIGGAPAISTLTISQTSAGVFHGAIGGSGTDQNNLALVKAGPATLVLNNANTYLGATAVHEGILRLGVAGSITQTASLAINANAGVTAALDVNGRTVGLAGGITLGGADSLATPQILDTAGGGRITLGGNIVYDATNSPLGATIAANLHLGAATRTFTANDSASTTTELSILGNVTTDGATTANGVGLVVDGAGNGLLAGNVTLDNGTTNGDNADFTKNGTGTWTLTGTIIVGDNALISAGTFNINTGGSVTFNPTPGNSAPDFVIDTGAAIVNLNTANAIVGNSNANIIYVRDGGTLNVNVDNAISGMDELRLGDNSQGIGNVVVNGNISIGILTLGSDSAGEVGNITGSGTISGVSTLNLDNGMISANITGVGNIDKDNLTMTLSGNNALTGTTLVQEGSLILDFATNNAADSKIGTGSLTLGTTTLNDNAAVLSFLGNSTAASLQTVANLAAAGGPSQINLVSNGGQDMVLRITGTLTRTAGTLDISAPSASTRIEYTGATTNTNGMVGAWLTLNNRDFAAIAGGQLQAAAYTVQNNPALWTTNANITNGAGGFAGTMTADCNTINSLRFDAAAASTITLGGSLVLSSGGILESAAVGASASTITGGSITSGTGFFIFHQNNTASTLTIASNLLGGAVITKNGAGVLVLSGANATGTINIDEGILRLTGGRAISDTSTVNFRDVAGAGIELMASQAETIGSIAGDGTGGVIILNTGSVLTLNQNSAQTFGGVISGAGTLVKSGSAVLTLTSASTLTGTLRIEAGQITLSGANAQFATATAIILNGAGSLADTQDQTSSTSINRINNSAAITLNNTAAGSGISLTDSETTSDNAEVVGALTLGAGHNIISSTSSVAANVGTLTFSSLAARTNRATVLVRGASLGDSAATQRGQITFTTAPSGANAAVGGGGAAGSTNISIFPWVVGDTSASGLGNSFVRNTGATNGLKPLTTAEYINDSTTITGTLTDNIRYTATAAIANTPAAINSLVLDSASGIALTGSASSMEITSGAILAAGAGNHSIGAFTGLTTGGGRDYTIYVTTAASTLTINTPLTSAVPLVKSGAGTLSLAAVGTGNAFTDVYLNQGTLLIDDLDRINGTTNLRFFGGGIKVAAGFADDLSAKTWDINTGGGTIDVSLVTAGTVFANGIDDSTPNAADTLTLITRAAATGTSGQLTIQGSSSFIGTTIVNHAVNGTVLSAVVLNGSTNAAISGNLQIGNLTTGTLDVIVSLGADEQIVDTAAVSFVSASGAEAYFKLYGRTETVAGISAASRGVIENFESASDQVAGNAALIVNSGDDFSYTGFMRDKASGTGGTLSFTKQGAGVQTLAGANIIYTGATTVSGGTLRLTNTTAFNSNITNNATLDLNATTGTWTLAKLIGGSGTVLKTGAGTLVLSGANTYSGQTNIEQGVVSVGSSGSLGDGSATNSVRLANNATLQSTGADVDLGANRSVILAGTGGTVEVAATGRLTASGAVVGDGCHVLTKTGNGVLALSNAGNSASFAGATQVNAGILQAGVAGTGATGSGSVIVAGGATLAGSGVVSGSTILSTGAVLQAGDVTTVGTAATTLTGNHTLAFTAANNALTVENGAQIKLGLGSTATYNSTGLANALTAGTYTNALAYISANSSEFTSLWEVAPGSATAMDFLNLTGAGSTVTIGDRASGAFGNGSVVITGLVGAQAGQVFNLMDWKAASGILGSFDTGSSSIYDASGNVIAGDLDLAALGAGLGWDVSAFAQYGIIVVVPEPSRAVLLLLGLLGFTLRRRRRQGL